MISKKDIPEELFESFRKKRCAIFIGAGLSIGAVHIGHGRSRSVGPAPVIIDTHGPVEIVERSNNIPVGPLVFVGDRRSKDDRTIRAEIKALEAEREALRAEQKAQLEFDRADRIRRGELVVYEEKDIIRRERETDEVVVVKKDKKGRMSIVVPRQ